jgi:hypothetical protein
MLAITMLPLALAGWCRTVLQGQGAGSAQSD